MRIIAHALPETEENVVTWAEAGVIGYIPSTAAPGLRTIPDPGCSTLRPTGRAGAGGAVDPSHARAGEYAGLIPVTKSPNEPGWRLASYVDRSQGRETCRLTTAGSHEVRARHQL